MIFGIGSAQNKEAETYFFKATKYLYEGQFTEALSSANHALRIAPRMLEAWNTKASALQMLGRDKEAISAYLKGLEININDEVIRENLLGFLLTNVFNKTKQGEALFNSLSFREQQLIQKLLGN